MNRRYPSVLNGDRMAYMARRPSYYRTLTSNLLALPRFEWDRSSEIGFRFIEALSSIDDPDLAGLCRCYLLAQDLIYTDRTPEWAESWFQQSFDPDFYFRGTGWERVRRGRWRSAPILVAGANGRVRRRHVLVGMCPESPQAIFPAWAEAVLDGQARSAAADAARAVTRLGNLPANRHPFCFPLVPPNTRVQIRGRSLGLSVALAFLSAVTGDPVSEQIAATGSVSSAGKIEPVGRLAEKAAWLDLESDRECGPVRAFLYPLEEMPQTTHRLARLPVFTLDHAWMFARLYAPGREDTLLRFSKMLQKPDVLIRNITAVPPDWLGWARQNRRLGEGRAGILSDPVLFSNFVDVFEPVVTRCELAIAREMAALIPPEELGKLTHEAPLAAFRWCSLNLALANHEGASDDADVWIDRGLELVSVARRADLAAVADFFNHHCVALHNRYRFQPETPDYLQSILDLLEKQYEVQKGVCPTFPVLGRLYGTLVQHWAFCGADHLDRVRSLSEKARIALGRDSVPEYRPEWLRQYSYLAYAFLDAGKMGEAEQALFRYLEVTDWDDVWGRLPGLNQWGQALLARCLADFHDAGLCRAYQDRMEGLEKDGCGKDHPWQLWCWNRGRIALCLEDADGAAAWFRKSLALCLFRQERDTVRVMALLPMAGLRHVRQVGDAELKEWEGAVREAARRLNPAHFRMVAESTRFEAVLERVWASPGDLFPFSYR